MTTNPPRAADVLSAAMYVARKSGLQGLNRDRIAKHARVSAGTVSGAFGSMDDLKSAVVKEALRIGEWKIVCEAIVLKHPAVKSLSKDDRLRALATQA